MTIVTNFINESNQISLGNLEGFLPLAVGERFELRAMIEKGANDYANSEDNGWYEVIGVQKRFEEFPKRETQGRVNYVVRRVTEEEKMNEQPATPGIETAILRGKMEISTKEDMPRYREIKRDLQAFLEKEGVRVLTRKRAWEEVSLAYHIRGATAVFGKYAPNSFAIGDVATCEVRLYGSASRDDGLIGDLINASHGFLKLRDRK